MVTQNYSYRIQLGSEWHELFLKIRYKEPMQRTTKHRQISYLIYMIKTVQKPRTLGIATCSTKFVTLSTTCSIRVLSYMSLVWFRLAYSKSEFVVLNALYIERASSNKRTTFLGNERWKTSCDNSLLMFCDKP